MTRHPYIVALREPGNRRPYFFHTIAGSEAEARRIARLHHRNWHVISTHKEA
jgi:hypothetical protein